MRVLYSHYLTEAHHPAAKMVQAISERLRTLGHEVIVHGSDGPWNTSIGELSSNNAGKRKNFLSRLKTRLWFGRGIATNFSSLKKDLAAVQAARPDVILCRSDPYRFSMHWAARKLGVPLVTYVDAPAAYECRGFSSDRWHPPGLLEAIEKWGLKQSRAAITISHPAKTILDNYGTKVPVHAVSNGVELSHFAIPSDEQIREQRQKLGITTPNVAGFLGTFQRFHGVALLADLIEATTEREDLSWLLIGSGPELPRLKQAAQKNPRVIFTGRQAPEEAAKYLSLMDVMVAPHARQLKHFYFCPLKILESMAAGAVCLASDQGDIPLILDHGDAGRLVSTNNLPDWKAGLYELFDHPAMRTIIRQNARRRLVEEYTWEATASRVAKILESTLTAEAIRSEPPPAVDLLEAKLWCVT
ncbi:glycosyltransferase [Telmatocola sphagniphila]|uniref:Glycosyltransferase n=1 Tax=Telmatocola sphagniphila TaxID=1123043 RepID=A0A8E6B5S0_9BACT|nr:glycosyltransferase [Telmatocola sphagniphila]QVL31862.1 glycosyltransferase [Telmatocola sphagniphila]